MITVRFHGRGGQGAFTAAKLLGEAVAMYGGKQALAFPSFGPERRGAPVLAFVKIDDTKIYDRSEVHTCDYVVVLDETLFNPAFFNDLSPHGRVILNTGNKELYAAYNSSQLFTVDASRIALEILGRPITNTAMLAALSGISDIVSVEALILALENYMNGAILEKNKQIIPAVIAALLT
ncbi:MAG: 2-oxoacid:acceptor oxidoreductase family protein [Bacteroidales bacterium]|jgi:pyruvate ferredoxin oxidoreductase gamma subunit|nr:2-oxoacid:acceptor oxidoreductase family protein [Bacteroidales bacterium]